MTDPTTDPAPSATLDDNDPLVKDLRSKGLNDEDIASVLDVVSKDAAKDANTPATPADTEPVPGQPDQDPVNENLKQHETAHGAVVEYDADKDVTSVEHSDGTRTDVDGDYYDVAVAVSTLFDL